MSPLQKKLADRVLLLPDLIEAVMVDDAEKVRQLLTCGVDPNGYEDQARVTPLHFAAQHNSLQSALLLVEAGADVNAETSDGLTPLEIARINCHEDMMLALLTDMGLVTH